jgi:hypothetical protein
MLDPSATLPAAIALALAHVVALPMKARLLARPRSVWLSIAGGIALGFATMHDFPSLASSAHGHEPPATAWLRVLHDYIYVMALAGFALFFGLGRAFATLIRDSGEAPLKVLAAAVGAHALLNGSVGYVLAEHVRDGKDLAFYVVAMAAALLVLDCAYLERGPRHWERLGRWAAAAGLLAGWAAGAVAAGPEPVVAAVRGFVVGAVAIGVLHEEMRDDAEALAWPFLAAVLSSAAVVITFLEFD